MIVVIWKSIWPVDWPST